MHVVGRPRDHVLIMEVRFFLKEWAMSNCVCRNKPLELLNPRGKKGLYELNNAMLKIRALEIDMIFPCVCFPFPGLNNGSTVSSFLQYKVIFTIDLTRFLPGPPGPYTVMRILLYRVLL